MLIFQEIFGYEIFELLDPRLTKNLILNTLESYHTYFSDKKNTYIPVENAIKLAKSIDKTLKTIKTWSYK